MESGRNLLNLHSVYPACRIIAFFPEGSAYFSEWDIVMTDRNDVQNYENKTQVARNHKRSRKPSISTVAMS